MRVAEEIVGFGEGGGDVGLAGEDATVGDEGTEVVVDGGEGGCVLGFGAIGDDEGDARRATEEVGGDFLGGAETLRTGNACPWSRNYRG